MRKFLLTLLATAALASPALAQAEHEDDPHVKWSFDGPFGSFDYASAQRGFQIYEQVCSNCHSMKLLSYRDLRGIGLDDAQIKAIAAQITVPGGTNDQGEAFERPALPSDPFKAPWPNDKAARAANGGALPPDQSLIVKARENGPDYIHALLMGYVDPPAGTKPTPAGQYYNKYFPGHYLAMPPPLQADQIEYTDGTKATLDQEAKDIVMFLTWASEPTMEQRKQLGVKAVVFLALLTGLTYGVKRKVWKDLH